MGVSENTIGGWDTLRRPGDDSFLRDIGIDSVREIRRLSAAGVTLDIAFLVYLRRMARFGYFRFGPITIDVRLIEDIVERTTPRVPEPHNELLDDNVRFSKILMEEVRRSGRRRIDELHFLLAFMRVGEGLPARVFGELGVTVAQVEEFARRGPEPSPTIPEKLYTPEEAAEYLGVHVQTVRAWIRSGRLRASRLAGQRALRITGSDLRSVLEPVEPGDV
jgi:excisionase family DNA binding protein